MKKLKVVLIFVFFVAVICSFELYFNPLLPQKTRFQPMISVGTIVDSMGVLERIPQLTLKDIQWQEVHNNSFNFDGRIITGHSRVGILIDSDGGMYTGNRFENAEELKKMGWKEDFDQLAQGAGGARWGYKREINTKQQILNLYWQNLSLRPATSGGMEAKCPCTIRFEVFLSNEF